MELRTLIPVDWVPSDIVMPKRTAVVVIGGGVIGACIALSLAERGVAVVLVEKGEIAAEQSARNMGWCRKTGRAPAELRLIIESERLWRSMAARAGRSLGYQTCGILYMADSQDELDRHADWLAKVQPYRLDTRMVTAAEIDKIMPGNVTRWVGGIYTPSDSRAEPRHAGPAIAEAARRAGAAIFTRCAVRTVEFTGGRVSGVVTQKGAIACDSVVLAGGTWSTLFCEQLGIDLPLLRVNAPLLRTEPANGPLTAASGSGFAMGRRPDGGYNLVKFGADYSDFVPETLKYIPAFRKFWKGAPANLPTRPPTTIETMIEGQLRSSRKTVFEAEAIRDERPNMTLKVGPRSVLGSAFPALAAARVRDVWDGQVQLTPDFLPILSAVATLPGFFIATGFSGHGFGIAPGVGHLMADLITGGAPLVDPKPFDFARLAAFQPEVATQTAGFP